MALSVKLVVVGGDVKTTEIKLKLPAIIGRGKGCTIVLPHALVSRQHCELFEQEGLLCVRDLGSLNGTFVNSERIESAPLPPENLLTVGAVTFRAQYEAQTEFTAPAAGGKPRSSRETETFGVVPGPKAARPAPATIPAPAAATPDEPVDVEVDFDLNEAEPLFQETTPAGPSPLKAAAAAPQAAPPQNAAPAKPAAAVAQPAAPVAAAPVAAAPAPADSKPVPAPAAEPAKEAAGFGFLDAADDTESATDDGDDDDLQDFLKNLNK